MRSELELCNKYTLFIKGKGEKRGEKEMKKVDWRPTVFVSGGQTGADSIPIEVYKELDIKLMGFMPKGYPRTDGKGKAIARKHGFADLDDPSYSLKDKRNAALSCGLLAFLVDKPRTGRGTMQTVSLFTRGIYNWEDPATGRKEYHPLSKPEGEPAFLWLPGEPEKKPALVIWDLTRENIDMFVPVVTNFLMTHKLGSLMFSGPTEETDPHIASTGAELMRCVLTK